MSEVAGRMSIQVGRASLQKANGGFGILLGGVRACRRRKWLISAVACRHHAAEMASPARRRHGGRRSVDRLRELFVLVWLGSTHGVFDHRDHRAAGARCGPRRRGVLVRSHRAKLVTRAMMRP